MPENTPQKDVKQYSEKNPFITWGLLVLCCFLLAGILIILYKNNQIGRYALHIDLKQDSLFWILDTKTGRVWWRCELDSGIDYGTIEKPAFKYTEFNVIKPEKPTFERNIIPAPTKGLVDLGPAPSD
jgi:hypothetical protein